MSSSLEGKKFQTCGSARCCFQVLGGFLPSQNRHELLNVLPSLQHFANRGSRFPVVSSAKMGPAAFVPRAAGRMFSLTLKCTVPLLSSASLFHHSGLLNICTATYFSAVPEGSHPLRSGSRPHVFGQHSAHLTCLQLTPPFQRLSLAELLVATGQVLGRAAGPQEPSKAGSLNVIVGNGEANVVVVTSHFVVGRAANRNDAFHSQLVHREVIGVNDPSVPVRNTTRV